MTYRFANKTVYPAKYHLMRCSKCRRGVLAGRVGQRPKEIISQAAGR